MSRLLDEKDIVISRLNQQIDRLEKDNKTLVDRQSVIYDNLEQFKTQVRTLQEVERKYIKLQQNYDTLFKALESISSGDVEDVVGFAKRKLNSI